MSTNPTASSDVFGCDETRVRKTGEVFAQLRFNWPVADPPGLSIRDAGGDFASKIAASPAGMATWAGTGPQGETCEHCRLFKPSAYLLGSCEQYVALRKAQGEEKPAKIAFPARTPACRYFRP
jgi:hypothetical protein